MSLTTRCPNCKTVFQFPPSLISESGGWAKCKRCHEVFNAAANLMPQNVGVAGAKPASSSNAPAAQSAISAKTPNKEQTFAVDKKTKTSRVHNLENHVFILEPFPSVTQSTSPASHSVPGTSSTANQNSRKVSADPYSSDVKFVPSQPPFGSSRETLAGRETRRPAVPVAAGEAQKSRPPGAIPRTESSTQRYASSPPVQKSHSVASRNISGASSSNSKKTSVSSASVLIPSNPSEGVAIDTVSIIDPVLQAKKSQQDLMRNRQLLVLGAVVALLVLFLQVTLSERHRLATYFPATTALLKPLCQVFACSIEPLKKIDVVAIENSSFHINGPSQVGNVEEQYQLTWSVSNKARHEVAMPNLELTLNDVLDRPLLRRVLSPQDLGFSQKTLAAEGVWEGSTIITVVPPEGGGTVSGYRLTVFYY